MEYTRVERDRAVLDLYGEGLTIREISEALAQLGYRSVSSGRVHQVIQGQAGPKLHAQARASRSIKSAQRRVLAALSDKALRADIKLADDHVVSEFVTAVVEVAGRLLTRSDKADKGETPC